jgi:hypothetical protein
MGLMRSWFGCSSRARSRAGGLALATLLSPAILLALSHGCVHAQTGREVPSSLLEISSDTADADVWVDGQYIGQVAAVSGRLKLAAGVHRVEIRKPGHFPVQRTVRVDKQGGGAVVVEAESLADPR